MSALHTFSRLRPTDEPLDEMTSARIWRAITSAPPFVEDADGESTSAREWIDPLAEHDRGHHSSRRRVSTVAAAAIVIAGLGGVAGLHAARSHDSTASLGTASAGAAPAATLPTAAPTDPVIPATATPTSTSPTTTTPHDLPGGGMWIGGQIPSCTRVTADTYQCTLTAPYDASMPDAQNEIGLSVWYLDDSSLVAGGCRTTTADARNWLCYVGQRAVDEGYVLARTLGTWQPNEFAAG